MANEEEAEVRDTIVSMITLIKDVTSIEPILKMLINSYLDDSDKRVRYGAQNSIREILSQLLNSTDIPIAPTMITPLAEIYLKGKKIEVIIQTINFCFILLKKNPILMDEILKILANVAILSDSLYIQLEIVGKLKSIDAWPWMEKAIFDIANDVGILKFGLARKAAILGDYSVAKNEFEKFLTDDNENPTLMFELGLANFLDQDLEKACQAFTRTLEIKEDFYLAYFYRGRALMANEQYEDAIQDFDKLIEINYDFSPGYYYRALARETQGYIDFAIDDLAEAIRVNPEFLEAILKQTELYYIEHDFPLAKQNEAFIATIDPSFSGINKKLVLQLAGFGESRLLINHYPWRKQIDELHAWLASINPESFIEYFDEFIGKLNQLFGEINIRKYISEYFFTSSNCTSLIEYPHQLERFYKNFIEYVLTQEVWEAYCVEYEFIKTKNNRETNLLKLVEESKINNIFNKKDTAELVSVLKDKCQLYCMSEFLKKYVGNNDLQGGYAVGLSSDLARTYDIFHKLFDLYHYATVYAEAVYSMPLRSDTEQFFSYIMEKDKPIIFFVPTAIGDEKNKKGVTYEEMKWVANTFTKNPEKLKNIILVFDSYNFLPFYIFQKTDSLNVDTNISLKPIVDFLSNYILDIGKDDYAHRLYFIKKNILNNFNRNISGYILADLREAFGYPDGIENYRENPLFIELKKIISEFFSCEKLNNLIHVLDDFYKKINNIWKEEKNEALLRFMCKLFINSDYGNYINPDNKYIKWSEYFFEMAKEINLKSTNIYCPPIPTESFEEWENRLNEAMRDAELKKKDMYVLHDSKILTTYPSKLSVLISKTISNSKSERCFIERPRTTQTPDDACLTLSTTTSSKSKSIQQTMLKITDSEENNKPRRGFKNEASFKDMLFKQLPLGFTLGTAYDRRDCFFDALAQCVNQINKTDVNTAKYLRELCHEFYLKNSVLVDHWNLKDWGGIERGKDEYFFIQYTAEECEILFHGRRAPIWGRPHVEGFILCRALNLKGLCIIEILEDPETKQPVVSFNLVAQEQDIYKYKSISEEEAQNWLSNPHIPSLVVEQKSLHFVPLIMVSSITEKLSIPQSVEHTPKMLTNTPDSPTTVSPKIVTTESKREVYVSSISSAASSAQFFAYEEDKTNKSQSCTHRGRDVDEEIHELEADEEPTFDTSFSEDDLDIIDSLPSSPGL